MFRVIAFIVIKAKLTAFLSFFKRERERFPLVAPKRYCISNRTFPGVLDRLHERS